MKINQIEVGQVARMKISNRPTGIPEDSWLVVLQPFHEGNNHLVALVTSAEHRSNKKHGVILPVEDSTSLFSSAGKEFVIHCDHIFPLDDGNMDLCEGKQMSARKADEVFRKISAIGTTGVYSNRFSVKDSFFRPDIDPVHYAGRVYTEKEMLNAVAASLDFYLTEGRFAEEFACKIADFLGVEHVLLTNSGSSANLLAMTALTSEKLGERRLVPGDEVISVAAGFPATVAPIIQNNLVPVFLDVSIPTYNIRSEIIREAITPKTKCIFIAHTLGNPFDLETIMKIAEENQLWVIEDNCDAFGSSYRGRLTGTFGHISTISFYPAHHITTGEGGAVVTNDPELAQIIRSFRDWGRDCYCAGGENNTCGKRFTQQFGTLPYGYDHKYVYSELGYNLKMTDIQAAIGSAQMDKLPDFCATRKENFGRLCEVFGKYPQFFILPQATAGSDPAWFAFIVTLHDSCPFTRTDMTKFFSEHLIETRNLFAGNLLRHPGFIGVTHRISGSLEHTEKIMNDTFLLGTYPGLKLPMIEHISHVLDLFLQPYLKSWQS